jgi:DNA mismatch repair ATPase MutS
MKRNSVSKSDIEKRMQAQWTDELKTPLANAIIVNDNNTALIPQVISIIEKIKKPEQWEYNEHLILYNNAIHQLNIVPIHNGNKSLFDIIQKTSTSMGRRLLKFRIMNPITYIK